MDIPSPEEVRAFLAALDGRWRPILLTAVFTGLRASELRGLRWTHSPLAIAQIGKLSETLADRSLHIAMRRRMPGEVAASFRLAEPAIFPKWRERRLESSLLQPDKSVMGADVGQRTQGPSLHCNCLKDSEAS
jgi:integrase